MPKLKLYLAISLGYLGWALALPAKLFGVDYTIRAKATIEKAKELLANKEN